jgi:hypothetical protein
MTEAKRESSCLSCNSYDTSQRNLTQDMGMRKALQYFITQVWQCSLQKGIHDHAPHSASLFPHYFFHQFGPKSLFHTHTQTEMNVTRKQISGGSEDHTQSMMQKLNTLPKEEYKSCFKKWQNHHKQCTTYERVDRINPRRDADHSPLSSAEVMNE